MIQNSYTYKYEIRYKIQEYHILILESIMNLLTLNFMQIKHSVTVNVTEAITKGYARIPFTNVFTVFDCASSLHNTESG